MLPKKASKRKKEEAKKKTLPLLKINPICKPSHG